MFTNLVRNPTEPSSALAPKGLLNYSVTAPFRVKRFGYTAPILGQLLRATANGTAAKIFALAVADRLDRLQRQGSSSSGSSISNACSEFQRDCARNVSKTIAILNRILNPQLLRLDHHITYTNANYYNYNCLRAFTTSAASSTSEKTEAAVSATEKLKQIFRQHDKIESYFCAIGGQSDLPPPSLTPEQVTAILRTNESFVINQETAIKNGKFMQSFSDVYASRKSNNNHNQNNHTDESQAQPVLEQSYKSIDNEWVTSVECNQLASNHPIEDRLRVSTLHLDGVFGTESKSNSKRDSCMAFGVFDGHNGGLCADIVSKRLFNYITIALKILELKASGTSPKASFTREALERLTSDHQKSPSQFYHQLRIVYQDEVASQLCERIEEFEWRNLEKFASDELQRKPLEGESIGGELSAQAIEDAIRRSFNACDDDLSREIEFNLMNTNSNVLLHYYLSLAVSGSCATISILYKNRLHIASTGDCRAVLGTLKEVELDDIPDSNGNGDESPKLSPSKNVIKKKILKTSELLDEHNSENLKELRRLTSEHPEDEKNYIIRDNRLLGQLMPLRAFGDFSFKWSVAKMRKLGLTKAFGSHIIASHYRTPPYLTAEPETLTLNLADEDCGLDGSESEESSKTKDRFLILATDGLWEQFETTRKVVKSVNRYRQNFKKQLDAFNSDSLFKLEESSSPITLGAIVDRMRAKGVGSDSSSGATGDRFERITADDDLIEDINCGTFLLRDALSDVSGGGPVQNSHPRTAEEEKFSHHVDQYENQRARHSKLVSYLTLPQSVVRNFRDDISLIVVGLKSN